MNITDLTERDVITIQGVLRERREYLSGILDAMNAFLGAAVTHHVSYAVCKGQLEAVTAALEKAECAKKESEK